MTRVYFVRHAQPDFKHNDDRTRPLSAEGKVDAAVVLDVLRDAHIDCFFSSPYLRSMDTIRETASFYGLPIRTEARFRERTAGPGGNNHEQFQKRWADFDYHEVGGESLRMTQTRNIEALSEILAQHSGQNIVIGTHGTALSTIINFYVPAFGLDDFLRIIDWMPYVAELDFDGQRFIGMHEHAHVAKVYNGQ